LGFICPPFDKDYFWVFRPFMGRVLLGSNIN